MQVINELGKKLGNPLFGVNDFTVLMRRKATIQFNGQLTVGDRL
jgi:hypothetical protein